MENLVLSVRSIGNDKISLALEAPTIDIGEPGRVVLEIRPVTEQEMRTVFLSTGILK